MEKGTAIQWSETCTYVGSKHSTLVNMNQKPVVDDESLKYYCFRCEHKDKCKGLLIYAKNGGEYE